jgi:PAS domain-containing protein
MTVRGQRHLRDRFQTATTGYVRTVIDITDRTDRAPAGGQLSVSLPATLVDAIPNPIFFQGFRGVYNRCQPGVRGIYRASPRHRIIGGRQREISPRDLAAVYEEKDRALFANPGVQVYESGVRYADGSIREVIFTKAPYRDAAGRVSGLIGTIMDITDRKRSETALKTANKKLNLLAGLTRHDVLNQLTVLLLL